MPIAICADWGDGCLRRMILIVNIELIYGRVLTSVRRFQVLGNRPEEMQHSALIP